MNKTNYLASRWFLGVILIGLCGGRIAPAQAPAHPKLVVVVSIDQFRGDYLTRFDPYYGEGGFHRIEREGFTFDNCAYESANTETGPGHATMLTGAYAHRSGITANEWYDGTEDRSVYCVADHSAHPLTSQGVVTSTLGSFSPRRLVAGTVGDNLEVQTAGHAKTISLSLKDRAAILMGGHAANLAVWFDKKTGKFVSSDYYGKSLPAWLITFNQQKPADRWFGKSWELSLPQGEYAKQCTPDDFHAEDIRSSGYQTRTFPHRLGWNSATPNPAYYNQLYTSPFGNDLLADLALQAIDAEALGRHDTPDLLTISFSSNDPIGHAFGPDSWEVMDTCVKTDAVLARLLKGLDEKVGPGKWTLFLTADHGIANFPEELQQLHIPAQRVSQNAFTKGLENHLRGVLGQSKGGGRYVLDIAEPWIKLNTNATTSTRAEDNNGIVAETVRWLESQPEVVFAASANNLLNGPASDPLHRAILNTWYRGRAGEVAFALAPHDFLSDSNTGTVHGTPYRYDQYVPLLACGAGISHGRSSEPVAPPRIAPTAALLLGTLPPDSCEVPPLTSALTK